MSYKGSPYEVVMWPVFATDQATPSGNTDVRHFRSVWSAGVTVGVNNGFAAWGPGLIPHTVRAVGVEMLTNQPNPFDVYVRNRPIAGTPSTEMTFPVPTTAATGKVAVRYATALIEVEPGEKLILQVSSAVNGARGIAYLLVEPSWRHPATMAGVTAVTA